MSRSLTDPNRHPARPATRSAPIRRITIGHLASIATALVAGLSLFAFVLLHRSPLPEESALLVVSMLADPWHSTPR